MIVQVVRKAMGIGGALSFPAASSCAAFAGLCATLSLCLAAIAPPQARAQEKSPAPVQSDQPKHLPAPSSPLPHMRLLLDTDEASTVTLASESVETSPSLLPASGLLRNYAEAILQESSGKDLASIDALKSAIEREPGSLFLRLRLAQAYLSIQKIDEAEAALKAMPEPMAGDAGALRLRAKIAFHRQAFDEAIRFFEQSLEKQPRNKEALQTLAILYYEHRRDMEKTKEVSKRLLEIDGRNLQALICHAEASALTGEIGPAADLFERLVHYRPELADRIDSLAQRLYRRGRRDDAFELYSRGVLMAPDSQLLQRGFETLAGAEDTTATLAAYDHLAAQAPLNADIQRLYAKRLQDAQRWTDAEAQFRRTLELQPGDLASLTALAEIALQQGNLPEATARYEAALDRHPTDPEIYAEVARLHLLQGNLDAADRELRHALFLGPQNPTALVLMADVAERKGNHDASEDYLKQALDAMPANPTLLGLLAGSLERRGEMDKAAEVLEQLAAARPRDPNIYGRLFTFYLRSGREKSADLLVDRGRREFNFAADFDVLAGRIALQEDAQGMAEESLLRALQTDPRNFAARRLLASLYVSYGETDEAAMLLKEIENWLPGIEDRYVLHLSLADVYSRAHLYDDAIREFRRATEVNPDPLNAYDGLVEAMMRAGKVDEGIVLLNEIVRRFAADRPLEVQRLRARALMIQKKPDRALGILQQIRKEHPRDLDTLFMLGVLNTDMKNEREAEAVYRQVLQIDPQNPTGLNNLGYLYAQRGVRLDDAETLILQALAVMPGAGFMFDSLGWTYFRKGDFDKARLFLEQARMRMPPDPEVFMHWGALMQRDGDLQAALRLYKAAQQLDPELEGIDLKIQATEKKIAGESTEDQPAPERTARPSPRPPTRSKPDAKKSPRK